jgi:hypothetical protein
MKKLFLRASAIALALFPAIAEAQTQQILIYCGNLPGCPSGFVERFSSALAILLVRLPTYVYVLGVLFIMIGGAYMVISAGDDEKVTKGKNTITWAIIGIGVMQFAQQIIGFVVQEVGSRESGPDLVESVARTVIGGIFDVLFVALLGVAIYSGMRMVLSFGEEDGFKKGREGLLWAAVGAIIINLAQAIANAFMTL